MNGQLIAELQIETAEEMHDLGLKLAKSFRSGDLVLLTGLLGAGKTTLSRGIGEGLEAIGTVSSPTFVIARTHRLQNNDTVLVHVDAYRLGSAAELDDLDIDFPNSITLVEWGKGLTEGLAQDWLEIEIDRDHTRDSETGVATEARRVRITGFGSRWATVKF